MSGIMMMVIAIVVLGGAYIFYGRYLEKKWGIDPNAKTPAYEMEDGVDYVPADTNIVFGHQFASIAGAGPINGPIQAAIFGWLPVLLWILIGGVFFGAVQDFSAMYASVKNKGRSIGSIIETYIGKTGKKLFLLFCWLFCILVVAAFADVVAGTFNGFLTADDGTVSKITANGAVATTSMIFIVEAVCLGMILRYGKLHKWVNTAIAIVILEEFLEGQTSDTGYRIQRCQCECRYCQIDQGKYQSMWQTDDFQEVCNCSCEDLWLCGQTLCCCFSFCERCNGDQSDDSQHTFHQHGTEGYRQHVLFIFNLFGCGSGRYQ